MFAPALRRWIPLVLLVALALGLRTYELDRRPLHADEANQAIKTGELLEHGRYAFDPRDHHGPTLYYAALPLAWLRGETTLATLSETTIRLVPALAGTCGVLLLFFLARPLGFGPAFLAAALLAVAPASVYYSRYFIQETLLVTFALAAALAAQRWWQNARPAWALATGAALGLMQATKASAPVFVLCALAAALLVARCRPATTHLGRDLTLIFGTALGVAALFYSSFGTHAAGLRDAVATYTFTSARATGDSGHEKPWWYYAALFGWEKNGGLVFQQLAFSALALTGALLAFVTRQKFLRIVAVYTLLVFFTLSFPPYKTPWHTVHLVPGLAVLAAGTLALIRWRTLAVVATTSLIFLQLTQTHLGAFLRAADARNPYAYVHSSPDVLKIRTLANAALAARPGGAIRIISEEYWPIPWYLRTLPAGSVGYWATPPADCDGALILASTAQASAVRERLHSDYRETFLGLRPGFLCVVFTPAPPAP
jgi:uncharacterized protein (TIGR03663 family)